MNRIKEFFKIMTPFEYGLWACSVVAILLSFFLCKSEEYITLIGSIIGVTSLIFLAKGNVIGNVLVVIFSILYGITSYFTRYYGEMITYLGMTLPTAVVAIVSWLRHPFDGKVAEVKVNRLKPREYGIWLLASVAVTVAFYFILRALNTANLVWSTVSVLTSFYAAMLNIRRSPFYALAYAANDVVLIVLWSLIAAENTGYVCMTVCFGAFLLNDVYGFLNWRRMLKRQTAASEPE